MFEKGKELFYKWCNKFNEFWEDERYFFAILTLLPPPILVGLLLGIILKAIIAGFNFLCRYYVELILVVIAICVLIAWWDKHKADKIERKRKEQEIRERQNYSDRLETAQMKEAAYAEQGKIVFSVSRELGPLGVVPPATPSNIYSPGRTISKAGGTVSLSLFLLQKDRETVDTDLLKHTLQTKIDQRLQAGEFPGIPEQHVYRGHVYSGMVVDMVRDSMGGYVEVYTAFADDVYCCYHENRELNKYRLLAPVDRRDTDY